MELSSKRDTQGGYNPTKRPNIAQISRSSGVSFAVPNSNNQKKEEETRSSFQKKFGTTLVISPSTKEILDYSLQQSQTPGSVFSKGKIQLGLQELENSDRDVSGIYQKTKLTPSKSESKSVKQTVKPPKSHFYEDDELSRHVNKYLNENLGPSEIDWTSINTTENIDEEMSKVKMLEAWRFEMMKDKVSGTLGNNTELTQQYKSRKQTPQENHGLPQINTKLISGILAIPDEERKYKKSNFPTLMTESMGPEPVNKKSMNFGGDAMQSLENAIRETNQEILYELITKRIKDFYFKSDVDSMTKAQVRLHTKTIAESVVEQFKSLKGATNIVLIQNRVDYILGRLRNSKNSDSNDHPVVLQSHLPVPERTKTKPVIDYRSIEGALIKNYEESLKNVKELRETLKLLNKKSFKYNNQIKPVMKQLEHLETYNNFGDLNEKIFTGSFKKKNKTLFVETVAGTDSSNSESIRTDSENSQNSVEFIKLQKLKQEKKKAMIEVQNKLKELQSELFKATQETDLCEKELKAQRNYKIHYRIQLKDLYYKALKDETSLVDVNNTISYSRILRSLWKMGEEVKSHSFPPFLDQNSIPFFINYAKIQEQLEDFCRNYKLMFLIASSEDFKDSNPITDAMRNEESEDRNRDHNHLTITSTGFEQASATGSLGGKSVKDFHNLLDQFKDKMNSLKKVNLKAKKLTQTTHYNAKGKYITSKWEDVDPSSATMSVCDDEMKFDETMKFGDERSMKLDILAVRNSQSPLDKALDIIQALKKLRDEEMKRINNQSLTRDSDEKQKLNLKKIFRFLFGRKEGEKGYFECLREKTVHDQKNLRQISAYYQKTGSDFESPASPNKGSKAMAYYDENQIWCKNKTESPLLAGEISPFSGYKLNAGLNTLNTSDFSGDSVFKMAASKMMSSSIG